MRRYMLRRILFSLFSLLVVIATVMLLVYNLIPRGAIFQMDDVWNKKSLNDRTIYEYAQYQKFGYLEYSDFTSFLRSKYEGRYGAEYTKSDEFKAAKEAIQNENTYLDNPDVQEFIEMFEKEGYKIKYLEPQRSPSGKAKKGGDGYLVAVVERSVFTRLWNYLTHLITVETVNDVQDPALTERYVRVEHDPYSGLFAVVGSGTTHKYQLYFDGRFPFIHQNWIHLNLGTSFTKFRGQEITDVINRPTGDQVKAQTQYPAKLGTDEYINSAIDFHTLTYNSSPRTKTEMKQFPDRKSVV